MELTAARVPERGVNGNCIGRQRTRTPGGDMESGTGLNGGDLGRCETSRCHKPMGRTKSHHTN